MTFVLAVDDDPALLRTLSINLRARGYEVQTAGDGRSALQVVAERVPDLVLLDLGLPDVDGLEVLRGLRPWCVAPVIVVSARGQERRKVEALDAGADDYIVKPFGVPELLARMRVALRNVARRNAGALETSCTIGPLRIELEARRVFCAGEAVHLTPIEFKLLAVLVAHCGKIVTHRQLLGEVWGPNAAEDSGYLRVYMTHLRRKLDPGRGWPSLFRTEAGVGYGLMAPEDLEQGGEPRAQ
jgi:two-component system KDP operon response regulator KdpE